MSETLGGIEDSAGEVVRSTAAPRPMSASLVCVKESDRLDTTKLGTTIQDADLENEEISDQLTAKLLDESAGSSSRATCEGKR